LVDQHDNKTATCIKTQITKLPLQDQTIDNGGSTHLQAFSINHRIVTTAESVEGVGNHATRVKIEPFAANRHCKPEAFHDP
jgi:hypothetical protein